MTIDLKNNLKIFNELDINNTELMNKVLQEITNEVQLPRDSELINVNVSNEENRNYLLQYITNTESVNRSSNSTATSPGFIALYVIVSVVFVILLIFLIVSIYKYYKGLPDYGIRTGDEYIYELDYSLSEDEKKELKKLLDENNEYGKFYNLLMKKIKELEENPKEISRLINDIYIIKNNIILITMQKIQDIIKKR